MKTRSARINTKAHKILRQHGQKIKPNLPVHTGGSVGGASGCRAGGSEFDSSRTNTQGLKITE